MIATGGGNDYASGHNAIQIWSAKTGELLCAIEEEISEEIHAVFSSDQKKLISGASRYTATWHQIIRVTKAKSTLFPLSGNNRLLVSASSDKTMRLWDLDTNL
jgi:WD40 repeat protein